MTPEQYQMNQVLEALQSQLSSNFVGPSNNDLFDFNGAESAKDGSGSAKEIGFGFINSTGAAMTVALTSGGYSDARPCIPGVANVVPMFGGTDITNPDALPFSSFDDPRDLQDAGFVIDAVFDNGISATHAIYKNAVGELKVTYDNEKSPRLLKKALERGTVVHVYETHITSSDTSFFSRKITLEDVSPLQPSAKKYVNFYEWYDPSNNLADKVIVRKQYDLGARTVSYITIPAGATVNFNIIATFEANLMNVVAKEVAKPQIKPAVIARPQTNQLTAAMTAEKR